MYNWHTGQNIYGPGKSFKIELPVGCLKNWQKSTQLGTCQYRPGTPAIEKKELAKRNFSHACIGKFNIKISSYNKQAGQNISEIN